MWLKDITYIMSVFNFGIIIIYHKTNIFNISREHDLWYEKSMRLSTKELNAGSIAGENVS
jgi:hypothetical protein